MQRGAPEPCGFRLVRLYILGTVSPVMCGACEDTSAECLCDCQLCAEHHVHGLGHGRPRGV